MKIEIIKKNINFGGIVSDINITEDLNIDIEVRKITVSEVIAAAQSGDLKEMFGAGTAAVISPIACFGYKEKDYDLPEIENSFANTLKKTITDIQTNKSEDPYGWRVTL